MGGLSALGYDVGKKGGWGKKWNKWKTIADLLTGKEHGGVSSYGGGMACTSNIGNFRNYSGHILAACNTYACGRMAWDPTLKVS